MRTAWWILVTVAGCGIAGGIAHFPGSFPVGSGTQTEVSPSAGVFGLVMGTILALPLGVGQWRLLRHSTGIGIRWIFATAFGVGLMHAVGDSLPAASAWGLAGAADGWVAVGAIGGLAIGALQTLAARGRVLAWTWIATNAFAWPIGIALGLWLADAAGLMTQSGPDAWTQQHLLVGLVAGLVAGTLTAPLLARSRPLVPAGAPAFSE